MRDRLDNDYSLICSDHLTSWLKFFSSLVPQQKLESTNKHKKFPDEHLYFLLHF